MLKASSRATSTEDDLMAPVAWRSNFHSGQVRIWDWEYYKEERALTGHGWDVKTVEWHPYKSLIVSGSKDNLIKLWDPRTGNSLSTLYGHKNTVMKVEKDKSVALLLVPLLF